MANGIKSETLRDSETKHIFSEPETFLALQKKSRLRDNHDDVVKKIETARPVKFDKTSAIHFLKNQSPPLLLLIIVTANHLLYSLIKKHQRRVHFYDGQSPLGF